MDPRIAITVVESLASRVRVDVYRLLVRKGPAGLVAGEIAAALDLLATNASFHLKALTQVGLLTVEQEGRFQRYRANLPLLVDLIGYLTEECCSGHPEQCQIPGVRPRTSAKRRMTLFKSRSRARLARTQ